MTDQEREAERRPDTEGYMEREPGEREAERSADTEPGERERERIVEPERER